MVSDHGAGLKPGKASSFQEIGVTTLGLVVPTISDLAHFRALRSASFVRDLYSVAFGLLNDRVRICDLGEVAVKYCRILHVLCDEDSGKEFILCEYNRDADSYRSPWSNKFHPHLDDGMYPSEELRKARIEKPNEMKADLSVEDGHLCNMGKMIEELEGKLRNQLDQVYFGKTKEMVCTLRPPSELLSMTLPDSRNP
ncbi:probable F-actin-capping protein subunit beta [Tanacetum coccineum]